MISEAVNTKTATALVGSVASITLENISTVASILAAVFTILFIILQIVLKIREEIRANKLNKMELQLLKDKHEKQKKRFTVRNH